MKRDVVNIDVEALKRLIDERYDGSSMIMGRELDLGQTVKNALADGHICKAYARLIELETGVDIVKHETPSFDAMSTDQKITYLNGKIDGLYLKINQLEEQFEESQDEKQMQIAGVSNGSKLYEPY